MELHLRATGRHLPYGITQCFNTSEHIPIYGSIGPILHGFRYPRRGQKLRLFSTVLI